MLFHNICFIGLPHAGKTFIGRRLAKRRKCKFIDKLIVSTNSKTIRNYVLSQKVMCPFLRPENISNSKSRAKDVILHTVNFLKANKRDVPLTFLRRSPIESLTVQRVFPYEVRYQKALKSQ